MGIFIEIVRWLLDKASCCFYYFYRAGFWATSCAILPCIRKPTYGDWKRPWFDYLNANNSGPRELISMRSLTTVDLPYRDMLIDLGVVFLRSWACLRDLTFWNLYAITDVAARESVLLNLFEGMTCEFEESYRQEYFLLGYCSGPHNFWIWS